MTQQEILEYNKRCANIIGAKPCKDWQGKDGYEHPNWCHYQWSNRFQDNLELYSYRYSDLQFHSDWNWIMEVVEAIEKLDYGFETIGNYTHITGTEIYSTKKDKKESVIQAINRFLIWYNENKTN